MAQRLLWAVSLAARCGEHQAIYHQLLFCRMVQRRSRLPHVSHLLSRALPLQTVHETYMSRLPRSVRQRKAGQCSEQRRR